MLYLMIYLLLLLYSCAPESIDEPSKGDFLSTRKYFSLLWHGSIPICTGTLIDVGGDVLFLSAGHCVSENKVHQYSAFRRHGSRVDLSLKEWRFSRDRWKDGDYAVFEPKASSRLQGLPVCKDLPSIGSTVWSWIGPAGMEPFLEIGHYSGIANFPSFPSRHTNGLHIVSFGVYQGASGSGVLYKTQEGVCLWSVVVAYPNEIRTVSFVYPVISLGF